MVCCICALGYDVWCLVFGVCGLGFCVCGLEFGVWDLGFGFMCVRFGVCGLEYEVLAVLGLGSCRIHVCDLWCMR